MPRKRMNSPDSVQRSTVQPPRAPTGLPQGEHKALIQSQQAVPVDNTAGRLNAAVQAAQANPLGPGNALLQPTARPNEPPTAGVPLGPGPGPEAVPAPAIPTQEQDYDLARYLPMLEVLADGPTATNETRNFVRRLRGTLPPGITMDSIVRELPQQNR